ncbi:hypothetical protein M758_UG177300 [Ceratodon purpureus]|nr:hypothetical protein M758_UG177300 [Ceratodon purpureus]
MYCTPMHDGSLPLATSVPLNLGPPNMMLYVNSVLRSPTDADLKHNVDHVSHLLHRPRDRHADPSTYQAAFVAGVEHLQDLMYVGNGSRTEPSQPPQQIVEGPGIYLSDTDMSDGIGVENLEDAKVGLPTMQVPTMDTSFTSPLKPMYSEEAWHKDKRLHLAVEPGAVKAIPLNWLPKSGPFCHSKWIL